MIDFPAIPATMRVPVFVGGGHIEFGDRPIPEPSKGQLLLRVAAHALCGSSRLQYLPGKVVIEQ